jgi:phosphomannomutase
MTTALFMIRFALEAVTEGMTLSAKLASLGEKCYASGEINTRLKDDREAVEKIKAVAGTYVDEFKLPWRGVRQGRIAGTHEVAVLPASEAYDPDKLAALDLRVDSAESEQPQWWFSVRKSGNEPELRLNVESTSQAKMEAIRDELLGVITAR